MEGPMDSLFGDSSFDLNDDGKISGAEFIDDTFFEDNNGISSGSNIDEDNDVLDEIRMAGLDRYELKHYMDEDERREVLEDEGLDPDDFDDLF